MICCENCFVHPDVASFVRENGEVGCCDFCGSDGKHCIDTDGLATHFEPLLSLYKEFEPGIDCLPCVDLYNYGEHLIELIENTWGEIVSYDTVGEDNKEALWKEIIDAITSDGDWHGPRYDSFCVEKYTQENMWEEFSEYIKRERRFTIGRDGDNWGHVVDLIEMILPQKEQIIPHIHLSIEQDFIKQKRTDHTKRMR
jgi:hypothetical protein